MLRCLAGAGWLGARWQREPLLVIARARMVGVKRIITGRNEEREAALKPNEEITHHHLPGRFRSH